MPFIHTILGKKNFWISLRIDWEQYKLLFYNWLFYSVFKKPCHGMFFFLAGVFVVSQQPPKMDSYPFRTCVAPVILMTKCLGMDVVTMNAIFYVCRSVLVCHRDLDNGDGQSCLAMGTAFGSGCAKCGWNSDIACN